MSTRIALARMPLRQASRCKFSLKAARSPILARSTTNPLHSRAFSSNASAGHGKSGKTAPWSIVALALALSSVALVSSSSGQMHLEAPAASKKAPSASSSDDVAVEPTTSQALPRVLPPTQTELPSGTKLVLVGLGVRTVTFLGIRVYVAGVYVDAKALDGLSSIPEWQGFEAGWMAQQQDTNEAKRSAEALLSALLDRNVSCAIRIVPVRPTDFNHLRDGFVRAIQGRVKLARKANLLSQQADEHLNNALQELKEALPKASLPKGHALDLIFTPSVSGGQGFDLTFESGEKVLGSVKAPLNGEKHFALGRQLLLAYMADKDEISKALKSSVAQGFEDFIRRATKTE